MQKGILTALVLLNFNAAISQTYTQLASLPEAVSNNAVSSAIIEGQTFIYSFSGIDTTKIYSGIHNKGFKYDLQGDTWTSIDPLPSGPTRIAAGANTIGDIIYVIGGYHVNSFGFETSQSKVHRYDVQADTFLTDGASIPLAIDDHVQAVWRDSLLFVITGWSNNQNVRNVQIYDPAIDNWTSGTSVPNISGYRVFGASGAILGDTIYYLGGAEFGNNFPASKVFKKGAINPDNPTEIAWSSFESDLAIGYRAASFISNGRVYWVGGSDITYNFDGFAYNSSGAVDPNRRITVYDPSTGGLTAFENSAPDIMDLRGAGETVDGKWILAGGMENGPIVSRKTFMISPENLTVTKTETIFPDITVYPNPARHQINIDTEHPQNLFLLNLRGEILYRASGNKIKVGNIPAGVYLLVISRPEQKAAPTTRRIIITR